MEPGQYNKDTRPVPSLPANVPRPAFFLTKRLCTACCTILCKAGRSVRVKNNLSRCVPSANVRRRTHQLSHLRSREKMATSVRCLVGVRHLARLLTLMVLLRRGVVRCAQLAVTTDQIPPSANKSRIDNDGVAGEGLFSSEWLQGFGDGDVGCDSGRGSFAWRRHGFGSNVNSKFPEIDNHDVATMSSCRMNRP